ncbi:hypothetical protein BDZ91DRAFT_781584 [Kalaharituber pfeilii]|nr:hypothetical protein BDZ91DRAFT_781584 [Kalaharituber pfeilii]
MADDAPSSSKSAESPAPVAAENDATSAVAHTSPSPAKDSNAAEKSASRSGDDEDVEMKLGDEEAQEEEGKKDKSSPAMNEGDKAEENEGEDAAKAHQNDEEKEDAPAVSTPAKKAHKKKGSEAKQPARRKSVANIKDKDNNGTPAKLKKAVVTKEYKPEDLVLHKLKGYPPWPAVVLSDEVAELKPDLIKAKPGSKSKSKVVDESLRQAYPIAYLHNLLEFNYSPITDLEPLTKEHIKNFAIKGKKKDLIAAYEIAKVGVTMEEVRERFTQDPMAVDEDEEEEPEEDVEEEEEEEEEDEEEEQAKTSKKKGTKRKKTEDSEDEDSDKPTKTPRRASTSKVAKPKTPKVTTKTLKAPSKATNGAAKPKTPATTKAKVSAKKEKVPVTKSKQGKKASESEEEEEEAGSEVESPAPAFKKSSKKAQPVEEPAEEEAPAVPPEDPEVARNRRHKEILYIRHRLQKGFLTRDHVPSDEEMPVLANHVKALENMVEDLEVPIIKETKINKVLKMITKLGTIPNDETYKIRERAIALLEKVNARLVAESEEEVVAPSLEKKDKEKEIKEDTSVREEAKKANGAAEIATGVEGKEDADKDEEMKDVGHQEKKEDEGEQEKEGEATKKEGEGKQEDKGVETKEEKEKEKNEDGDTPMEGADA